MSNPTETTARVCMLAGHDCHGKRRMRRLKYGTAVVICETHGRDGAALNKAVSLATRAGKEAPEAFVDLVIHEAYLAAEKNQTRAALLLRMDRKVFARRLIAAKRRVRASAGGSAA